MCKRACAHTERTHTHTHTHTHTRATMRVQCHSPRQERTQLELWKRVSASRGARTSRELVESTHCKGMGEPGNDTPGDMCKVQTPSERQRMQGAARNVAQKTVKGLESRHVQERHCGRVSERDEAQVARQGPIRMRIISSSLGQGGTMELRSTWISRVQRGSDVDIKGT